MHARFSLEDTNVIQLPAPTVYPMVHVAGHHADVHRAW